ncbi:CotH kinase family protein [Oscillospiraceae bacterium LCP25S3_E10]
MRFFKKNMSAALSAILSLLMLAGCLPLSAFAVSAETTAPSYVTAQSEKALWAEGASAATKNNIEAVKWYQKDGKYYWFLPSSANLSSLTVYHNFDNVTVDGTKLVSGESYSMFENGKSYNVKADGKSYTLCVQKAEGIGSMFFTTESGSMDYINSQKGNAESGSMVVIDYDGNVSYDNALDSIKGRGNTTWRLNKKPYNIKLGKKASLLGMDKNKKWCLLANAQEHSMIRNKLMYDLADEVGLDYTPDSRFVDLYANGEYLGTYQLTQKVEAGDGDLVNITDLEAKTEDAVAEGTGTSKVDLEAMYGNQKYNSNGRKAYKIPYNPEDITGGYLMEFVMDMDEPSGFTTKGGQNVNLKGPEYCTVEQINYIADFMQDLEDALYSSTGYNSKGKYYTDYIDIHSAAVMYLLQEFSVNVDGGISSCYFYKDSDLTGDGKVHASPCWDFDVALGNLKNTKDGVTMTSNNQWFIKNSYRYSSTRTVFSQLCQHDDFMTEVEKVWKEKFVPAMSIVTGNTEGTGRLKSMQYNYSLTLPSSVMNYTRWNISDNLLVPEAGTTHSQQFNYLVNFVNGRITFMNSGLLDLEAAKQQAITTIDNLINQYSSEYSSDVIAKMNTVAQKAKSDIGKATSTSQVNTILEKAVSDINACKRDVIYYDNSQTKWNEVYIYSWGGSLTAQWPGVKMKYEGNNVYSYTIEGGIENIIFSNGKNENTGDKRQTNNLTFQENKTIYTAYADGAVYDDYKKAYVHDGSWSKYIPADQVIYGDVNGDKKVTVADAVLMSRSAMEYITLTDQQAKAADVNGDGVVTIADIILVQRYALGYIDKFPVEAA